MKDLILSKKNRDLKANPDLPKRPKMIQKIRKTISKPKKSLLSILKLETSQLRQNPNLFSNFTFAKINTLKNILKRSLNENKFERLTQIQAKSFNPIWKRNNCVIKSETGSGKTLAYLVPLINMILSREEKVVRKDGTFILILCPVRELCLQILGLFEKLNQFFKRIVVGRLIGGEETKREKARLRKGINVLIATPGRLLYHIQNTKALDLSKVEALVIEECDKLLDIGMKNETQDIIQFVLQQKLKSDLQYILVSASITNQVEELLYFIKNCEELKTKEEEPEAKIEEEQTEQKPKMITIGENQIRKALKFKRIGFEIPKNSLSLQKNKNNVRSNFHSDNAFKLPSTINHFFIGVNERSKLGTFFLLLKILEKQKVMVFISTADQVNFLAMLFQEVKTGVEEDGVSRANFLDTKVYKIHGHMEQKERSEVFNSFGKCESGILLSTDIGSRGLDFFQTKFIIQYDLPASIKGYVNRVGRTARINSSGSAISLVYQQELGFLEKCRQTNDILFSHLEMDELAKFINDNKFLEASGFFEEIFINFKDKKESEMLPEGFRVSNFTRSLSERLLFLSKNEVKKNEGNQALARRAFNSFCRAYSQTKLKEVFRLKLLNLHSLSKGFCLESAKSERKKIREKEYTQIKDAKQLAPQQLKTLEKKNFFTRQGIKNTKRRQFINSEFM